MTGKMGASTKEEKNRKSKFCEICEENLGKERKYEHFRRVHPEYAFTVEEKNGRSFLHCVECNSMATSLDGLVRHYRRLHPSLVKLPAGTVAAPSNGKDPSVPDIIDSIVAKGLNPADVLYDGVMRHIDEKNSLIDEKNSRIDVLETTACSQAHYITVLETAAKGYEEKVKDMASKAVQARDVMVIHSKD